MKKNALAEVSADIKKHFEIILVPNQQESAILESCTILVRSRHIELAEISYLKIKKIREYPDCAAEFVKSEGVIPLLELLQTTNLELLPSILQLVNEVCIRLFV